MKAIGLKILIIVLGIFYLLAGLFEFLISNSPLTLFISSFGIVLIIFGIFEKESFKNKNFYLLMASVIFLQGVIIIITFMFKPEYIHIDQFFITIVSFIIFLSILSFLYYKNCLKKNNNSIPKKTFK